MSTTPVCDECPGRCCTSRRWVFKRAALTHPEESERPDLAPHVVWVKEPGQTNPRPGLNLDPRCPFLQKDNRCGIYETRPAACRGYICYNTPDIEDLLKDYPTHARLLRRWKVLPGDEYGLTEDELESARAFAEEKKLKSNKT